MPELQETANKLKFHIKLSYENHFILLNTDPKENIYGEAIVTWNNLEFKSISNSLNRALATIVKTNLPKCDAPFKIGVNLGSSTVIAYDIQIRAVETNQSTCTVEACISFSHLIPLSLKRDIADPIIAQLKPFKIEMRVEKMTDYAGKMFSSISKHHEREESPTPRPSSPTPLSPIY